MFCLRLFTLLWQKLKKKLNFYYGSNPQKKHIVQLTKDIIPPLFFSRLTILNTLVHSYNLTTPLPDPPYWLYYLTIDTQTNKKRGYHWYIIQVISKIIEVCIISLTYVDTIRYLQCVLIICCNTSHTGKKLSFCWACMSATGSPQAVLLSDGDGPVWVPPAVTRLTFCTLVTGLYDYDQISLGWRVV